MGYICYTAMHVQLLAEQARALHDADSGSAYQDRQTVATPRATLARDTTGGALVRILKAQLDPFSIFAPVRSQPPEEELPKSDAKYDGTPSGTEHL